MSLFTIGSYWCSANCKLYSVNSPSEAESNGAFPPCTPSMQKQKRNYLNNRVHSEVAEKSGVSGRPGTWNLNTKKSVYFHLYLLHSFASTPPPVSSWLRLPPFPGLRRGNPVTTQSIHGTAAKPTSQPATSSESPLFVSPSAAPSFPLHWTCQSEASFSRVLDSVPVHDVPSLLLSQDIPLGFEQPVLSSSFSLKPSYLYFSELHLVLTCCFI